MTTEEIEKLRELAQRAERSRLRGLGWRELERVYPQQILGLIDQLADTKAAAERDRDADQAIITAMGEALEWVIDNDNAGKDEAGVCEEECCETPMIAACRKALDAARRATTKDGG